MNLILIHILIGLFCLGPSNHEIFLINQNPDDFFPANLIPHRIASLRENTAQYSLFSRKVRFANSPHEQQLILGSGYISDRNLTNEKKLHKFSYAQGAIIRGDKTKKELAMVFTGDQFGDGLDHIRAVLSKHHLKASFF